MSEAMDTLKQDLRDRLSALVREEQQLRLEAETYVRRADEVAKMVVAIKQVLGMPVPVPQARQSMLPDPPRRPYRKAQGVGVQKTQDAREAIRNCMVEVLREAYPASLTTVELVQAVKLRISIDTNTRQVAQLANFTPSLVSAGLQRFMYVPTDSEQEN